MQPLAKIHLLIGFDFLEHQAAIAGNGSDVDEIDFLSLGRAEKALDDRSGDRVAGQLGGQAAVGDREPFGAHLAKFGQQYAHFFTKTKVRLHLG